MSAPLVPELSATIAAEWNAGRCAREIAERHDLPMPHLTAHIFALQCYGTCKRRRASSDGRLKRGAMEREAWMDEAIRLRKAGWMFKRIGKAVGVRPGTVQTVLNQLLYAGVFVHKESMNRRTLSGRQRTLERHLRVVRAFARTGSLRGAAAELGITFQRVEQIVRRAKYTGVLRVRYEVIPPDDATDYFVVTPKRPRRMKRTEMTEPTATKGT